MFLILSKRRYEVIVLGKIEGEKHRKVLSQYSARLLDQMIGITTGRVLLSYLLYCTAPETVQKFGKQFVKDLSQKKVLVRPTSIPQTGSNPCKGVFPE
jgi:Cu/Ag efflux pump CusA